MGQKIVILIVGLAAGVGVGYLVAGANRPESAPDRDTATLDARIVDLERLGSKKDDRIADLETMVDELKSAVAAAETRSRQLEATIEEMKAVPEPPAEPEAEAAATKASYRDLEKALGKLGAQFQQHMFGNDKELAKEIQNLFATASPEDVQKLIDDFTSAGDLGKKTVMAHFLGMSHHPMALKALEEVVRDKETNLMDRRVASHGLAFSGSEAMKPLLRELAREDPDRGTRANSAFGLDRMGDPEGIPLYFKATDEAFREQDPLAVMYLAGLPLMGDRALPAARDRLGKYSDWQAKLQLINYIQGRKDRGSLNLLSEIARDATQNASVRKAAESAIRTIEAE
jgi:HEAT repeat protein